MRMQCYSPWSGLTSNTENCPLRPHYQNLTLLNKHNSLRLRPRVLEGHSATSPGVRYLGIKKAKQQYAGLKRNTWRTVGRTRYVCIPSVSACRGLFIRNKSTAFVRNPYGASLCESGMFPMFAADTCEYGHCGGQGSCLGGFKCFKLLQLNSTKKEQENHKRRLPSHVPLVESCTVSAQKTQ